VLGTYRLLETCAATKAVSAQRAEADSSGDKANGDSTVIHHKRCLRSQSPPLSLIAFTFPLSHFAGTSCDNIHHLRHRTAFTTSYTQRISQSSFAPYNRMVPSTDMTARQAYIEESHPSLQASMDDFEAREFSPTFPELQSQHSGFRSGNNSEYSEQSSRRSYSPPAWRKAGSGWFQHPNLSPSRGGFRSKEPSPQYHDAEDGDGDDDGDVTIYRQAVKKPLPGSPTKGRSPSNSPEPQTGPSAGEVDRGGGAQVKAGADVNAQTPEPESPGVETPTQSNCK
jgi:hypothetical protein